MAAILRLLVLAPIAVLVVLLAVANRAPVVLSLDPMGGNVWSVTIPLFVAVLGALMVGILIGGVACWLGQGRYRRAARDKAREAQTALAENDRLRQMLPATTAVGSVLPGSMIR